MSSPEPSVARVPERRGRPTTPFDTRPFLAIWEVTQACDLACVHCRACAVSSRSPDELSTTEGKALLDTLVGMGVPLVVLTGGDPAQRPDLVELVRHGAERGLAMAVTPSGTPSTTKALLAELRGAGLARLAVSLDGPDAASHDGFRRVAGSFDETLRILREARALGLELQINTTLGPQNHERLAELAALVTELGAVLWSVFFVVPTGRADQKLLLGPRRVEALLEALAELSKTVPFDIKTTAAPHYRRVLLERHEKGAVGLVSDVDEDGLVLGSAGHQRRLRLRVRLAHGRRVPERLLAAAHGQRAHRLARRALPAAPRVPRAARSRRAHRQVRGVPLPAGVWGVEGEGLRHDQRAARLGSAVRLRAQGLDRGRRAPDRLTRASLLEP
jgi:MoaA/NifB/PqqE/SkfB family radical SAM enzyme